MKMPDMILCDEGHGVVCYLPNYSATPSDYCPLCEAIEKHAEIVVAMNKMEAELRIEIEARDVLLGDCNDDDGLDDAIAAARAAIEAAER